MSTPAAAVPGPSAHADETVRREFETLLADWAAAIVANDPARIARFAEPDWVITGPEGGPGGLDQFLQVVASGELTHSEMAFELLEVRVLGDVAVVLAHGTNRGTWRGSPFGADEWVTEVFVRRGEEWRCTMSALTPNYAAPVNAGRAALA
ncbi:MAG: nuclear transport factor 2 family protein [Acidimicrobiales bacterium]